MQNGSTQAVSDMFATADDNRVTTAAIRFTLATCDLGWALVAATRSGICAMMLGDDALALETAARMSFPHAYRTDDAPDLIVWMTQVQDYIVTPRHKLELPLHVQGTAFQQRVVGHTPGDTSRQHDQLRRACGATGQSTGGARRGPGLCYQRDRHCHSVPSRHSQRWHAQWLSLGSGS